MSLQATQTDRQTNRQTDKPATRKPAAVRLFHHIASSISSLISTMLHNAVRDIVNTLPTQPRLISNERIALQPGSKVRFDDLSSTPGAYTIYINTASCRPGDNLSITTDVRPSPDSDLSRYLSMNPSPISDPPLWDVSITACSGFSITFDMLSGRPVVIHISVWSVGMNTPELQIS